MKLQNRFVLSLLPVMLAATAVWANISTDYDRSTDFHRYKTYSWTAIRTADPLLDQRVKDAVNSELAAKGLTLVPSGGEVNVTARAATHDQQTLNTFYDGLGGRRFGGGIGTSTTTVDHYKVGTLVVELFDAGNKNMIWRGASSDTLSSNSDKNIHKMFDHFPPGSDHK